MLKEISELKKWFQRWQELSQETEDVALLKSLAEEEKDPQTEKEVVASLTELKKELDEFEFQTVLSGEDDFKNVLLSIHSGAGGTESQDWAQMLLRMYTRWVERKGFKYQTIDFLGGE